MLKLPEDTHLATKQPIKKDYETPHFSLPPAQSDYLVVKAANAAALETAVNKYLVAGYILAGGISAAFQDNGNISYLLQALVKQR